MQIITDIPNELYSRIKECEGYFGQYALDYDKIRQAKPLLEERKVGRWAATENEDMEVVGYYCSRCDLPMETDEKTDYCPNCGAIMVKPIGK